MSQTLIVLRCFSCETFQVHIRKLAKKWECKMCREKQSLQKIYFKGSGKDCRTHVQKLNNLKRREYQRSLPFENDSASTDSDGEDNNPNHLNVRPTESKWTKYLDPPKEAPQSNFSHACSNQAHLSEADDTVILEDHDHEDDDRYHNVLPLQEQCDITTNEKFCNTADHKFNTENKDDNTVKEITETPEENVLLKDIFESDVDLDELIRDI